MSMYQFVHTALDHHSKIEVYSPDSRSEYLVSAMYIL